MDMRVCRGTKKQKKKERQGEMHNKAKKRGAEGGRGDETEMVMSSSAPAPRSNQAT